MKILALSDRVIEQVYSSQAKILFPDVDLILGCGDLPYYYLEYVLDTLNVPAFYVRGNHDPKLEFSELGEVEGPGGVDDLHRKIIHHNGLLIAGFEGSIRYSKAHYQYTQSEMWSFVLRMIPRLLWNRLTHGRYLDILVRKQKLAHTGVQRKSMDTMSCAIDHHCTRTIQEITCCYLPVSWLKYINACNLLTRSDLFVDGKYCADINVRVNI